MGYLLVALTVLSAVYQIPSVKGRVGEWFVSLKLSGLNRDEYKVINNLLLIDGEGNSSQIDHVVVSCYGIFVLEVKNYKGYVFGKDSDMYWTVALNKRTKHKLYSPIRQNAGHVKALQTALARYSHLVFHPIVVFAGSATLRVNTSADVIYLSNLRRLIKSFNMHIMPVQDVDEIYNQLLAVNVTDKKAARRHAASVRRLARSKSALRRR